jgi:uncharacterized membrane protein
MWCHYGQGGFSGMGMFAGFGGIVPIVITVVGILLAIKLAKDIFASGKKKTSEE